MISDEMGSGDSVEISLNASHEDFRPIVYKVTFEFETSNAAIHRNLVFKTLKNEFNASNISIEEVVPEPDTK